MPVRVRSAAEYATGEPLYEDRAVSTLSPPSVAAEPRAASLIGAWAFRSGCKSSATGYPFHDRVQSPGYLLVNLDTLPLNSPTTMSPLGE
jgi:hypothetical protein